jgi:hypothetical protein
MRAHATAVLNFSRYQESQIRHFHEATRQLYFCPPSRTAWDLGTDTDPRPHIGLVIPALRAQSSMASSSPRIEAQLVLREEVRKCRSSSDRSGPESRAGDHR